MDGFVDESTDCIFLESGAVRLKKLGRNNSICPGFKRGDSHALQQPPRH